jgi:2-oxoglutarate dehydrogenase E2 component (dihydrolipoamide succinyltransferase)
MGTPSQRSEGGDPSDWTELERGFFAAAPPEVAVQPPPPPSFDDLVPAEAARPHRRRAAGVAREVDRRPRNGAPALLRRLARGTAAAAGAAGARAWRWTEERARARTRQLAAAARRTTPLLRASLPRLERLLRALPARIAADLPERPDGKTIAAALAAIVIVCGLSASVLGSRSSARRAAVAVAAPAPVALAAPPEAAPAAPAEAEPAPEAAPASQPSASAALAPKARVVAKRHHAKHHGIRTVAPSSASRANVFAR